MINQSVSIVLIGDELLIGQIQDTNSTWLMQLLTAEGITVAESRKIRDSKQTIVRTLKELSKTSGIILVTGGLGPTKDDCTKQAFAEFLDVPLVHNDQQWQHIQHRFATREYLLSPLHKQQAQLPKGVSLLDNPAGTALGITYKNDSNAFLLLPGVPPEMRAIILQGGGLEWIKGLQNGYDIYRKTFVTIGKSETWVADRLKELDQELPTSLGIAYLPSISQVKVRLTYRRNEGEPLTMETFTAFAERLKKQLGKAIYADQDIPIEQYIGELLLEKNKQLATAESCTGGYLAHLLTKLPGASEYYRGSIIAYHNDVKRDKLNVSKESLKLHGAVSEEVVIQMAQNVCKVLSADYGISISGIAGPGGGTKEKPVGTIWIAVADKEGRYKTQILKLPHNRSMNIKRTSILALNLLRNFLLE